MAIESTLCPACRRATRTIAGLCPNCGRAKPGAAAPTWISPEAPRIRPAFLDVFGEAGPYLEVGLVGVAVALAVTAFVLIGTAVLLVVVAGVAAVALLVWALVSSAGS